jgi:hypothetical protein
VCDLIGSHCLKYGTAAGIIRRKSREVFIQMTFHLPLRLDDEAEARPVA